jgi:hypothetical protein
MTVFLILGGIVAFTGAIVYYAQVQQKKRTLEMSTLASGMGWGFEEAPTLPPVLRQLEPFKSGHSHRVRNRISRTSQDQPVAVFDFFYTTGGGKSAKHHRQTVAHVPLERNLPQFSVRAEHLGHRILGALGMQDIDFPEYPAFSQRYLLRGPDEIALRHAFRRSVIEYFEGHTGLSASCSGPDLFLWMNGLAPAAEIETRMAMLLELKRRFTQGECAPGRPPGTPRPGAPPSGTVERSNVVGAARPRCLLTRDGAAAGLRRRDAGAIRLANPRPIHDRADPRPSPHGRLRVPPGDR